jgi:DNA-binding response OmpR family regulator
MDGSPFPRLLLVEDEHVLRHLVAQFLRIERFAVVEAVDGLEGANLFASQGPFDVILLDLNLPRMTGVEVCRRVKQLEPAQPVVIFSASLIDEHIAELERMGVRHFVSKPCHPAYLLEQLHLAMDRAGRRSMATAGNNRWNSGSSALASDHPLFKRPISG